MNRINILMACTALTMAFGCDDGRDPETDGGPITIVDAGDTTGEDAGDTTGEEDAGDTGEEDAGEPDTCPPATAPAPTMAACAAATKTCVDACTDSACLEGCWAADPSADPAPNECAGCWNQAVLSCASMNGCDEEWGEVVCCVQANCPDGSCLNMPTGPCSDQESAFLTCTQGVINSCLTAPDDVCYMTE